MTNTITTPRSKVWSVLTILPALPQEQPRLKTNLDTNLLTLVAVVCLLLDHFGGTFFEQVPAFRWAGRLAFPLFCYCMTVGMLYTHDIKR